MQSTSVIGFNFTVVRTFFILHSPQIRTLFVHPTHPTNMRNAITSCLFGNGSTSHTQIHISMVLLNLLPSEAAKAETEYARRTGTSFGSILPCSKTPYLPSTFLHIRFTLIEELT
jgi:hypothetical protein